MRCIQWVQSPTSLCLKIRALPLTVLTAVLLSLCVNTVTSYTFPESVVLQDGQQFEYIVVGAGAGGSALAARLALAGKHVLLIEAGGDPNLLSKFPGTTAAPLLSEMNWRYKTLSNNVSCLSSVDQACIFFRGKCLGGSTSVNYMVYDRGNRKMDFKEIPYPGWTFDDLMPYFLRYEGLQDLDKLPSSSIPYHNTTGTMRIGFFGDPHNPWHSRLKRSFMDLNIPENSDVDAESQIGFNQLLGYVYEGQRMSTARGYLCREDVKKSLKVAKNTTCTGVIIDKSKVARGVTAVQGPRHVKVFAQKEVILCAGTIGTPQILMLSGVGSAIHLKAMGITVKADLPVGEGMIDHVAPHLIIQVDEDKEVTETMMSLITKLSDPKFSSESGGALAAIGITDLTVFMNTHCYDTRLRRLLNNSFDGSDCEVPNLQIMFTYVNKNTLALPKHIQQKVSNLQDHVMDQFRDANMKHAFITVTPVLLEAYSEGFVRLTSKDPRAHPAIFPNYLDDERDLKEIVRFIEIIELLVQTSPFKRRHASLLHLQLPGCPRYEAGKAAYWRCYSRHMLLSAAHAAGTARLGRVLDARLRVRGVRRLRVADLSVLPRPPRASTEAVTIAIGERASDFILEDNK